MIWVDRVECPCHRSVLGITVQVCKWTFNNDSAYECEAGMHELRRLCPCSYAALCCRSINFAIENKFDIACVHTRHTDTKSLLVNWCIEQWTYDNRNIRSFVRFLSCVNVTDANNCNVVCLCIASKIRRITAGVHCSVCVSVKMGYHRTFRMWAEQSESAQLCRIGVKQVSA